MTSVGDFRKGPNPGKSEFAFIGRSNVGKSSLINALVARKELAKVSKRPGKTQSINYFLINNDWYLVDLPGYGYAQHSKKVRNRWQKMIEDYLLHGPDLDCVFCLIDFSIPPQKIDMDFVNWMGENQIPFSLVYTKMDKLKPRKWKEQKLLFDREWAKTWEPLPQQFYTSSVSKTGLEDLHNFIADIVKD